MSLFTLLPLLFSPFGPAPLEKSVQQCQKEQSAELRLACYDALGRVTAIDAAPTQNETGWRLDKNAMSGDMTLTRQALPGAAFSVACLNTITHIRVRMTLPWEGESVTATTDGVPASGNWFVRDKGRLLEFGRGLPAIDELKRWSGQHELVLASASGREVRIPLTGMGEALKPLRQQCRW